MPSTARQMQAADVRYPRTPVLIDTRTGALILSDAVLVGLIPTFSIILTFFNTVRSLLRCSKLV